jgi:uncharacterized membrane protein
VNWIWNRINRRNERGAVLVLAAAGIVLATISAALAVDLGRLAADKRSDQKVADLAALDGARLLPADPTPAVDASLTRNDFPYANTAGGYGRTVELGYLNAGNFVVDPTRPEALRVTVKSPLAHAFLPGGRTVTAKAISKMGTPLGTVRVGSYLATVNANTEKVLDKGITRLAGGNVDLDAVGWKGLADTSVTFQQLRTALGMNAGSPNGVLNNSITWAQLLNATVAALNADGSPSKADVATALGPIANTVTTVEADPNAHSSIKLGDLFNIVGNVGNGQDVADVSINVLDIVRGGGILADKDHFATFNLSATDIPGVTNCLAACATVSIGLIERPQQKSGPPKDTAGTYWTEAKTAQIRTLVEVNLGIDLPIGLLGALVNTQVKVPIVFEGASAVAKLDTIHCTGNSEPSKVDIWASSAAATTKIGAVTNAATTLHLATPPVLGAAALVNIANLLTITLGPLNGPTVAGEPGTILSFLPPYAETSPSQRIGKSVTEGISLPNIQTGDINVSLALLVSLDVADIKLDLSSALNVALPSIGTNLLRPLYEAVGVSYAGADVWAPPVQTCSASSFTSPSPTPVKGSPSLVG